MNYYQFNKRWEDVLQVIRERLGPQMYNTWFSQIKYVDFKNNELYLAVPSAFCKNWIEKNYYQLIKDILIEQLDFGEDIIIKFNIELNQNQNTNKGKKGKTNKDILQKRYEETGLNVKYTFDNFVVGDSNRFAHAACLAVAQSPAKSYNPLFVYGGVGLGKTHLMHGIGNYIINKNSIHSINIAYISSEKFTNELINAIKDDATEAFREKYRNFDILLIDDIQFLAGKERTQEEFFHTFNSLYNASKQIVITSDRPPKEITNLENRLISRFEWGLITDIQPPDLETRIAILQKKAEAYQLELSDEIINYIANKIPSNIRQLEGALNKLNAYITLTTQREVDLTLAKQILKDFIPIEEKEISIQLIQKHTAEYFNLKPVILLSKKRTKNIVAARHIAMYLARELTDFSLPMIGNFFGGKDHTTVIHSCNKIKEQLKTDKKLKLNIDRLINKIQNSS
ncbi:MAG: chromosomal replication initiator protein DnaA [Atribacterota bacterium]|nr:chromosomal replication initiator protein DnaA [Atribacterota bacterium]MDD4895967.1 chromosomal replication initiator protein DnaA [Atribacterota bacterium]MDD5638085.1 chromosomal replication initiator protein DnaA [Atribacterota bacterium]